MSLDPREQKIVVAGREIPVVTEGAVTGGFKAYVPEDPKILRGNLSRLSGKYAYGFDRDRAVELLSETLSSML